MGRNQLKPFKVARRGPSGFPNQWAEKRRSLLPGCYPAHLVMGPQEKRNGEGPGERFLTVLEASERLGVSTGHGLPAVQRRSAGARARPECRAHLFDGAGRPPGAGSPARVRDVPREMYLLY